MTGWRGFVLLAALVAAGIAPSQRAQAYEFKVLHNFCTRQDCSDGKMPLAGLVMDSAGNLYGTTTNTAFELVRDQTTGRFKEKVLYTFCIEPGSCAGDRINRVSELVIDGAGNLYGMTNQGKGGTVFELVRDAATGKFRAKLLYSFCTKYASLVCRDGADPQAGLIVDSAGNLYGTTNQGGPKAGGVYDVAPYGGTVFALVLDKASGRFDEKVLHGFCARAHCSDGNHPVSSLTMDGSGNLYGTTMSGGWRGIEGRDGGTVFKLVRDEITGRFKREKVLHQFDYCGKFCSDGGYPRAGVIMDGSGNLYGTTSSSPNGHGTVFELVLNKANGKFREKVLYEFCNQPRPRRCPDGSLPHGGLIMDGDGNLYGTTAAGGDRGTGGGTVFELVFNKDTGTFEETVLHSFLHDTGPNPALIMDGAGNLYGTTSFGGANGHGSVFELVKN